MKWLRFLVKSSCLFGLAAVGLYQLEHTERARLQSQIDRLEQEKTELKAFVQRLRANRRVAQVEVLEQYHDDAGRTVNVLHWQEVSRDHSLAHPTVVTALGNQVYFEGLVLKFDYDLVEAGDSERGNSLVLFRRVFGDQQTAESAPEFERDQAPGGVGPLGDVDLHTQLWRRFWDLIDDAELQHRYGVRVAQCEAPAVRPQQGQVWQIDLAAAGGLNLHRIAASDHLVRSTP